MSSATPAPALPEDQLLELLIQLQKAPPDQARAILAGQPQISYALIGLMVKLNVVSLDALQATLAKYTAQTMQPVAQPPMPDLGIPGMSAGVPGLGPSSTLPGIPGISAIPPHVFSQQQPQSRHGTPQYASQSRTGTPQTVPVVPSQNPVAPPLAYGMTPQQAYGAGAGGYANGMSGQMMQNMFAGYPAAVAAAGGSMSIPGLSAGGGMPQQAQQAGALTGPMLEALKQIPEDQKAMIIQVISMTPEQIRALPPQERGTVVQLRATLGLPSPPD